MIGRRISPIFHVWSGSDVNLSDALLSVPISLFLFLGIFHIRKILISLEEKNFELDYVARVDPLTGACSRAETFSRAQIEIKQSLRSKDPIAFLMIDIDHFKRVNDIFGHPAGDLVLTGLVKHCQTVLREIDTIGRVGGEEFFVILPKTDKNKAIEIAQRLRLCILENPCTQWCGESIFVTISIGAIMYDPLKSTNKNANTILNFYYEKCDQAMYRAKAAGRNQVSF